MIGRACGMYGCGNKLKDSLVGSLEKKRALARPMRRWHNDFEIDVNIRG
jgi:hypothetical protein